VITGDGAFKAISRKEDISYCIGTVYVIGSLDELRLSMLQFTEMMISQVASEDVSAFYLYRVGGWCLKDSTLS
jgi:hypothetical protein